MTGIQKLKLAALLRVQWFLDEHRRALAEVNASPTRRELDAALRALRQHAAAQEAMRVKSASLAEEKLRLREELRADMCTVVPIIQARIAHDPRTLARYPMPWKRLSDAKLVASARALASVSEKRREWFLEEGFRPEFAEELRAGATAVSNSRLAGDGARAALRIATKGVEVELDRGRRARDVLGGLVIGKLGRRSPLLAGWEKARRIGKKRGRKRRPRR